jgi:8-oxo-dGTP pyrophosphatase MutT (NUDIX family)
MYTDFLSIEPEYKKQARAGLIPYMRNERGELIFLMMIGSNAKFGGPRPMISKGKIEHGENTLQAALREAEEELGLRKDNIRPGTLKELAKEQVVLRSGSYFLTLYSAEILDRYDFGKWCYETEYTLWLTLNDFKSQGRKDHIKYIEQLATRL